MRIGRSADSQVQINAERPSCFQENGIGSCNVLPRFSAADEIYGGFRNVEHDRENLRGYRRRTDVDHLFFRKFGAVVPNPMLFGRVAGALTGNPFFCAVMAPVFQAIAGAMGRRRTGEIG